MGKVKWNDKTIKECVLNNTQSEYLGYEVEYKQGANRKRKRIHVKLICENCQSEYKTNIDNVKKGGSKWCRKCVHQKMIDNHKKHKPETVAKLFKKNGLRLLSTDYESNSIPLTAVNSDGYKVAISYNNLLKGYEPLPFGHHNPHSIENIKLYIERNAKGYKLLSDEYVKAAKEKLQFECSAHHVYETSWNEFRNGHRCPICNESKGEKFIRQYLDNKKISYIQEYRFDDCKRRNTLPFDFYLPNHNICIEYDGQQHFEPVGYFGGEIYHKEVKENDRIKNEYCQSNNIILIRVPYTVNLINKYLDERLAEGGILNGNGSGRII